MKEIGIETLTSFIVMVTLVVIGMILYKYETQSTIDIYKKDNIYQVDNGTGTVGYDDLMYILSCCDKQYVRYVVHYDDKKTTYQQKYYNSAYNLYVDEELYYVTDSYDNVVRVLIAHIKSLK